jgi:hypothetical protein
MSADDIPAELRAALEEITAQQMLDLTNPEHVTVLSRDMVAMMWDVPRENVRIDHAVILDEVLHVRGAVRTEPALEWIEISINDDA